MFLMNKDVRNLPQKILEACQTTTMQIEFTVAIRTYNAAERLPDVLDRLLAQDNPGEIYWEVLIVDNNSTDRTVEIVAEYAQRWRHDSQIRLVSEPRQGAGYGRELAMREAKAESLVGFLDDDNLPDQTWLTEAYHFGQTHPQSGAYGGNIYPKLAVTAPDNFHQIQFLLAIGDSGIEAFRYRKTFMRQRSPVNPGCVIRKQAWKEAVPQGRRLWGPGSSQYAPQAIVQGRKLWGIGQSQKMMATCAEDVEVLHYIINSQWEVWHNGKMKVWHYMPASRLEPEYLLKMARKSGLSAHALRLSRLKPWQQSLMIVFLPLLILWGGFRVALFYLRYHNQLETDIVKACLFQRQVGIFFSCLATPNPRYYDDSPNQPPNSSEKLFQR